MEVITNVKICISECSNDINSYKEYYFAYEQSVTSLPVTEN